MADHPFALTEVIQSAQTECLKFSACCVAYAAWSGEASAKDLVPTLAKVVEKPFQTVNRTVLAKNGVTVAGQSDHNSDCAKSIASKLVVGLILDSNWGWCASSGRQGIVAAQPDEDAYYCVGGR